MMHSEPDQDDGLLAGAESAVELLAAMAAHELLQPLLTIEAHVTLALDAAGREPMDEALTTIGVVAARTRRLVQSLLDDSRPDRPALQRAPVPMAGAVEEALAVVAPDARAREVAFDVGPDLPVLHVDPGLFQGLLTNLLANAVTHGRRGGTVRIAAERHGTEWFLCVSNPVDDLLVAELERLFEPHQRGAADPELLGYGLGLAICRRIAQRHGGRMAVKAQEDGGVTFVVVLPAT